MDEGVELTLRIVPVIIQFIMLLLTLNAVGRNQSDDLRKKRIAALEKMLKYFYKSEKVFEEIRDCHYSIDEASATRLQEREGDTFYVTKVRAKVVQIRYKNYEDFFKELDDVCEDFKVHIEGKDAEPVEELMKIKTDILNATYNLGMIDLWKTNENFSEIYREYGHIAWSVSLNNDPIKKRFYESMAHMKDVCKKARQGQGIIDKMNQQIIIKRKE